MKPIRLKAPHVRGDLMRRIAALYAQIADLKRKHFPDETRRAEVEELERQIVELERQLAAM